MRDDVRWIIDALDCIVHGALPTWPPRWQTKTGASLAGHVMQLRDRWHDDRASLGIARQELDALRAEIDGLRAQNEALTAEMERRTAWVEQDQQQQPSEPPSSLPSGGCSLPSTVETSMRRRSTRGPREHSRPERNSSPCRSGSWDLAARTRGHRRSARARRSRLRRTTCRDPRERVERGRVRRSMADVIVTTTEALRQIIREEVERLTPSVVDEWMTSEGVAAMLGVARSTIPALVSREGLPCYRPGKGYTFRRSEVETWLAERRGRTGSRRRGRRGTVRPLPGAD